ncbi:MAG: hypothetical protein LBL66_06075 [Clostridiales bacterium]|nr:hypothetical protein [Clostridiales bacterium]
MTLRGAFLCPVEIAASRFRAPRNDKGSSQCTVHSPQFRSGTFAHGGVPVFCRDCRVALCVPRNDRVFISQQV